MGGATCDLRAGLDGISTKARDWLGSAAIEVDRSGSGVEVIQLCVRSTLGAEMALCQGTNRLCYGSVVFWTWG